MFNKSQGPNGNFLTRVYNRNKAKDQMFMGEIHNLMDIPCQSFFWMTA